MILRRRLFDICRPTTHRKRGNAEGCLPTATRLEGTEKSPAPCGGRAARARRRGLEAELQPQLDDAVRLANSDYCCRGRERCRDAASLPEDGTLDVRRPSRGVARVFPV